MNAIVIVSAVRTAIGSFGGSLASFSAPTLGSLAAKEAVKRAGIAVEDIEEVVLGNVLQAGLGQNPARQAALGAGLPHAVPASTLNVLCGSGLKSVILGAPAMPAPSRQAAWKTCPPRLICLKKHALACAWETEKLSIQ